MKSGKGFMGSKVDRRPLASEDAQYTTRTKTMYEGWPRIRISAIRALYSYSQHLKSANTTQYLIPFLPHILDRLLSIASQFSSDVLSLCLETLPILLTVCPVQWTTILVLVKIYKLLINELSNQIEANMCKAGKEDEDEEEDY
uniref:Importin-9 n=1 Tax=Magallana gigas TaxID=29159 RepID=K1PYV4_MAGGI